MMLNLKNPLVFFDLETTGTDVVNDRIVEISMLKIHPNGDKEQYTKIINPQVPIPEEVSEIHGIKDDDVKNAPSFKEYAQNVVNFIEGCDLAGYNSNKFDLPLLAEEFIRADIDYDLKKRKFVDVQTIFHKMEKRTLEAAYKFYCDKSLDNAHSAEADTIATYEVLKSQIEKYDELENDVDFLSEFSAFNKNADFMGRIIFDKEGIEVINFGKYKGQKVKDILQKDPGYYGWIMKNNFPLYTKKVFTKIKLEMV